MQHLENIQQLEETCAVFTKSCRNQTLQIQTLQEAQNTTILGAVEWWGCVGASGDLLGGRDPEASTEGNVRGSVKLADLENRPQRSHAGKVK